MQDQRLATILWRGKYLILLALAVGIALAILATRTSTKIYQANAILQVNSPGNATSNFDPAGTQQAAEGLAQTYATRIVDRSFIEEVRPKILDGKLRTGEIQSRIGASAIKGTTLVELSAAGPSPDEARRLAQGLADAFVGTVQTESQERNAQLQAQIDAKIADLNARIEGLRAKPASPSTKEQLDALNAGRTALLQQGQGLYTSGLQQGGAIQLTAPPTGAKSPIKPRPLVNLMAGIVLGLLVGFGLAWLRARMDRGLHSAEEAEQLLEVPVLASIPLRRRFSADDPVLGEAYDVLRANLAFLSLDQPLQVVTFSSFNPGEGKTSTVEGLAYAAVRGGLSVLLIDGDVRTRSLSQRLQQDEAVGLTTVVVDLAGASDAIVELAPNLAFLPSGPTPPNPPSLLSSGRMVELMSDLRRRYQLIIIDSPPVKNLADASILASVSDGVVVVARVGVTNRTDLPSAAVNLRHSPTPMVGAVVLEPREIDDTYYPAMSKGRPVPETAVTS